MEGFLLMIMQQGFAVAVAAWLLIRTENRLEALTEAIQELRRAIDGLLPRPSARD